MMQNFNFYYKGWNMPFLGVWFWPFAGLVVVFFIVWMLYWKGRALWLAAKKGDWKWFVVLLVVNTLGILEILYIYVFSKKTQNRQSLPKTQVKM